MKTIIKVTSILALTAAAFLAVSAVNTDSASADEPVIVEIGTIADVSTIDPCLFIDCVGPTPLPPVVEMEPICVTPGCLQIDPCLIIDCDAPETPDTPDEPETPDTPDEPETPDTPDEPETPDTPDEPETPDTPDEPETPDTPDEPETPDTPDEPDTAVGGASESPTGLPNAGTGAGSASDGSQSTTVLIGLVIAGLAVGLALAFSAWRMKRSEQ